MNRIELTVTSLCHKNRMKRSITQRQNGKNITELAIQLTTIYYLSILYFKSTGIFCNIFFRYRFFFKHRTVI